MHLPHAHTGIYINQTQTSKLAIYSKQERKQKRSQTYLKLHQRTLK